jgi:hypothetical protein
MSGIVDQMIDNTPLISSEGLPVPSSANLMGSPSTVPIATTTPNVGQVTDTKTFITYLKGLISVMLECSIEPSNELVKCLNDKATVDCIKKFISESQVRSLIVHKFQAKDEEESETSSDPFTKEEPTSQYVITIEMHYTNPKCLTLQIIKHGTIVENDKKFSHQLRVVSLSDSSPYETLHSFVSNTLAPYFKSYIKRSNGDLIKQDESGGSNLTTDLKSVNTTVGGSATNTVNSNSKFIHSFSLFN